MVLDASFSSQNLCNTIFIILLLNTFQHSKLESEYILIKSGMQTEDRRLRQARDKNLEMEQENDSLSERIALL